MIVNYNPNMFIIQSTRRNLGRAFNSRCRHTFHNKSNFKLKNRHKQLYGPLPLAFALPLYRPSKPMRVMSLVACAFVAKSAKVTDLNNIQTGTKCLKGINKISYYVKRIRVINFLFTNTCKGTTTLRIIVSIAVMLCVTSPFQVQVS
jgi:hypothetical protein